MANDSLDIEEEYDFHPCHVPYSTRKYVLSDLTPEQQKKLNELKINTVRDNQKYLNAHPEIKAIVVLIMKMLLKERPIRNVHLSIGRYFTKPSIDIKEEIAEYLAKRSKIIGVNSTMEIIGKSLASSSDIEGVGEEVILPPLPDELGEIPTEQPLEKSSSVTEGFDTVKSILDEILENTFLRFGVSEEIMIAPDDTDSNTSTINYPIEDDQVDETYLEETITSYLMDNPICDEYGE